MRGSLAAEKIIPRGVGASLSGTALLAEALLPSSTTCATVCAMLVPPKHTIPSPLCKKKDNKVVPRGVGISLSGIPLLAESSLRGARPSGILMQADVLLHGASLGGTPRLAEASLRGAMLSGTFLLAGPLPRGVSLSGTLLLADPSLLVV
jgi:hypothetical protein